MSGNLARDNPGPVVRYSRVLIRVARWAADHPKETAQVLATELGVSMADIVGSYVADYHRDLRPNRSAQNMHPLSTQQAFMVNHGYLSPAVDLHAWAGASFLRQAYEREDLPQAA